MSLCQFRICVGDCGAWSFIKNWLEFFPGQISTQKTEIAGGGQKLKVDFRKLQLQIEKFLVFYSLKKGTYVEG